MPRLSSRSLPLVAVPVLVLGLFAAFQLQQARSWGGWGAPSARAGRPWTVDQARALLGIARDGQYYFNREPIRNETLARVLDSAVRHSPAGTPLYIYADKALELRVVDEALRIARASGVTRVSFVAEPSDSR
jgi:biopolymer transport protein ExbD